MSKHIDIWNQDDPCIYTVEKECYECFAAGSYGEVCTMSNSVKAHIHGTGQHETGSQSAHIVGGFVYVRNKRRRSSKCATDNDTNTEIVSGVTLVAV